MALTRRVMVRVEHARFFPCLEFHADRQNAPDPNYKACVDQGLSVYKTCVLYICGLANGLTLVPDFGNCEYYCRIEYRGTLNARGPAQPPAPPSCSQPGAKCLGCN